MQWPNLNTNRRVSTMNAAPYDILKKDALGNPIWVEAVEDLRKATVRIEELALDSPGEYIVFNQQTSQIITTAVSMRVEWCGAEAADC
jgi:hypothetical protein